MSLNEVDRLTRSLQRVNKVLDKHIKQINPEDNSLPIDGLHWLIQFQVDCKDLIKHLNDYDSYDLG